MTIPLTNWKDREQELRRQHRVESWRRTPQHIIDQVEAEKRDETAYFASLPVKQPRPTSARDRRAKRNAAKANAKKNGKRK